MQNTEQKINGLNELALEVHDLAKSKGWYDIPETDGQFIARSVSNFHGEISEFWEAHRNGTFYQPCDKAEQMEALGISSLSCAEEELADLIIRVLDSARN
jgi:NTP pyrophosphatase (non-canonical NTP hydrolase)